MSLGQNIAKLRKNIGMTQEQLAEKCDVSRQAVTKWESGESEPAIAKLVKLSEILEVSIDELLMGNSREMFSNKAMHLPLDYKTLSAITGDLTNFDFLFTAGWRKTYMMLLYDVIKTRYFDSNEKIFDEYLIENTSSEEREHSVKCLMFERNFAKGLFQEYVDGKCELDVIFDRLESCLEEYFNDAEKREKKEEKIRDKKRESQIFRIYIKAGRIFWELQSFEDHSEKKLESLKEELHNLIDELDAQTQVGRLMAFYLRSVEEALNEKNGVLLKELVSDWKNLKEFILGKINIDE